MRDRDEDMVVLYTDSTGKHADCRVRLITTGPSWRALYRFSGGEETKHLSGVGPGPDIFALAREALAEEQRESAPPGARQGCGVYDPAGWCSVTRMRPWASARGRLVRCERRC
jgi:hypothetical protein